MKNIFQQEEEYSEQCHYFDFDSQEQNQFQTTKPANNEDYPIKKQIYQSFDEPSEMQQLNDYDSNCIIPVQSTVEDFQDFDSQNFSQALPGQQEKSRKIIPQVQIKQPGETKNMPKCYGRQIQNYIKDIMSNSSSDCELKKLCQRSEIKKFLHIKSDDIGRKKLDEFINSEAGQIITSDFFGNCRWSFGLVKENKTNVESYFRHNISYFYETQKVKRIRPN